MARYGKRNETKFKFTKELGFLIGGIVAIIVATILLSIPNKTDRQIEKYNEAREKDGENLLPARFGS